MTDIGNMSAGAEMDARVERDVFGKQIVEMADWGWRVVENGGHRLPRLFSDPKGIAVAWEVVEMLHSRGLDIEIRPLETTWKATAYRWIAVPIWFADAPTAPLAICRVALKAIERQTDQPE